MIFDYLEPLEAFSEELRQLEKERTAQLEKIGERSATRFEPTALTAILRSHEFRIIEDISFPEIVSTFGRAVQALASGHLLCTGGLRAIRK